MSDKLLAEDVAGIFSETNTRMDKAIESMNREFGTVSTGRANPALLESLSVEYFGTPTPMKQLAAVNVSDPQTLTIQPWDVNSLADIERAISTSDLGLTPNVDGKIIRVNIPPLSTERRQELIKLVHTQAEDGRISVRTVRHAAKDSIERLGKDKTITEDEKYDALDRLEKVTSEYQKKIDGLLKAKEGELSEV